MGPRCAKGGGGDPKSSLVMGPPAAVFLRRLANLSRATDEESVDAHCYQTTCGNALPTLLLLKRDRRTTREQPLRSNTPADELKPRALTTTILHA